MFPDTPAPESRLAGLSCSGCAARFPAHGAGTCTGCGAPLLCRYEPGTPAPAGGDDVFRWAARLPVREPGRRIGLAAGPVGFAELPTRAAELGLAQLQLVRDPGGPGGSASARELAVAVAAAAERGATAITIASTGAAGSVAATYARRHGLSCRTVLPTAAAPVYRLEARIARARVVAVLGDRGTAETWVTEHPGGADDHVLSSFAEPFRLEGAKTLAFEIAERLGPDLPEAIVVPTGGGLRLVGLARGFAELQESGARGEGAVRPPRLFAAQGEGCAPIARAFAEDADDVAPWAESRRTLAESLRDPLPRGGRLALQALRETRGGVVTVSEVELVESLRLCARADGLLPGPEGAAGLAALSGLRARGELEGARVLVLDPEPLQRSQEALAAAGTG